MAQADVEVVGRAFGAWLQGGLDAFLEFVDPEVEWQSRRDLPDSDLYRGHAGVRRLNSRFEEDLEDVHYELEELIDAGDSVVFVFHWGGRGRASGIEVEARSEAWVIRVSAGKFIRVDEYANKEEAQQAAGASA